ncbi:MAG: hypothetical protein AB7E52_02710 [Bdellovibrionales bacterium]
MPESDVSLVFRFALDPNRYAENVPSERMRQVCQVLTGRLERLWVSSFEGKDVETLPEVQVRFHPMGKDVQKIVVTGKPRSLSFALAEILENVGAGKKEGVRWVKFDSAVFIPNVSWIDRMKARNVPAFPSM